jgi:hypothetical protein
MSPWSFAAIYSLVGMLAFAVVFFGRELLTRVEELDDKHGAVLVVLTEINTRHSELHKATGTIRKVVDGLLKTYDLADERLQKL